MDLNLKDKLFIVAGASSGLGKGVAVNLLKEGAKIIAIARDNARLNNFSDKYPGRVETVTGDITRSETINSVIEKIGSRYLGGMLVNSGGPTAKSFLESSIGDWDDAYNSLLR